MAKKIKARQIEIGPIYRATAIVANGIPNVSEDCAFTSIQNVSGYSLESSGGSPDISNVHLLVPLAGYYLVSMFVNPSISVAYNIADVNTSVSNAYAGFILTIQGDPINNNISMQCPISYTVTSGGATAYFLLNGTAATGIIRINNETSNYIRLAYINRVFDSTNLAVSATLSLVRLRGLT